MNYESWLTYVMARVIMLFPPHGTRERVVFDNFNTTTNRTTKSSYAFNNFHTYRAGSGKNFPKSAISPIDTGDER